MKRFDVIYERYGCRLDYHFCREWDEDGGCYGTNPQHGMSFEDAAKEVADWHQAAANRWRKMTLDEWEDQ